VDGIVVSRKGPTVLNCFTQQFYGYDGKQYVSYSAIKSVFNKILSYRHIKGPIAIPKIGCGLAGGEWERVSEIINKVTGDDLDVWVYSLEEE